MLLQQDLDRSIDAYSICRALTNNNFYELTYKWKIVKFLFDLIYKEIGVAYPYLKTYL